MWGDQLSVCPAHFDSAGDLSPTLLGLTAPSTTMVVGGTLCVLVVFAMVVILRLHGVFLYNPDTGGMTKSKSTPVSTDNRPWFCFFFTAAAHFAVVLIILLCGKNVSKTTDHVCDFFLRIMDAVESVVFTFALDHQRLYKHMDTFLNIMPSEVLRRQSKSLLRGSVIMLLLTAVFDVVTSEQLHQGSSTIRTSYWLLVAMLTLVKVPAAMLVLYVLFHQSAYMPSVAAKAFLAVGYVFWAVSSYPPSLLNLHILPSTPANAHHHGRRAVYSDCPIGGRLSIYDVQLILNAFSFLLVFMFVLIEYRRNRTIEIEENFREESGRLLALN
jgi:hypothetical protein